MLGRPFRVVGPADWLPAVPGVPCVGVLVLGDCLGGLSMAVVLVPC